MAKAQKTTKKTAGQLTWLPQKTFELKLTIPWSQVKNTYSQVIRSLAKQAKIKGFRKGQAPLNIVEKNLDQGKIYGEVVNQILPQAYAQAVTKHQLKPAIPQKSKLSQPPKVNPGNLKPPLVNCPNSI